MDADKDKQVKPTLDTIVDSEKRFKDAIADLIEKAVDFAVGKTLLILRDEGILKDD